MAEENQGDMTVREAGRKGGETVKEKYGPEFYSDIGEKGGNAPHPQGRGLENADEETRQRVAQAGGNAPHPHGRGLENADEETRQRVAEKGGQTVKDLVEKGKQQENR